MALFSNDLMLLPALVALSRRVRLVILVNISLAVVSKVGGQAGVSVGGCRYWG